MKTKKETLTVNGRLFVANDSAMIETLFQGGATAVGYFKQYKRGIELRDMQGEPFAFLCATHSTSFFVSASRQSNGKTRYSYGFSDIDAKALGVGEMTREELMACAKETWEGASRQPV